MNTVYWFFKDNEAFYYDQCQKAVRDGRIRKLQTIPEWKESQDILKAHADLFNGDYTEEPYDPEEFVDSYDEEGNSIRIENPVKPYVVIEGYKWEGLVAEANAKQMDIVNDPDTNLPMLKERPYVEPVPETPVEDTLENRVTKLERENESLTLAMADVIGGRV